MNKLVKAIADFITEDPNLFNEANKKRPKKKKRPKMDKVETKTSFEVEDALEDKSKPAKPGTKDRNQKSSLNKLTGAKQTGKPYLK